MNKLKNLFISIIIGLAVAVIAVAFTGPSSQPPIGNPDFWIKSGNDVYYNPAVSGNVGIGTASPGAYKLNVQGGQPTPPAVCVSPVIVKPRGAKSPALITGLFPAPICIPIKPVIMSALGG